MFQILLILSDVLLCVGIYKVFKFKKKYSVLARGLLIGGFITMLLLDSSGFVPALIDNGVWWYLLLVTPIITILVTIYTLFIDKKLVLLLLPQILFAIYCGVIDVEIFTQGIHFGMML